MALQLEVESLDGMEEGVQQFYQQGDDGKYRLAVDGLEDTSGLKSALEKERKARRDYEKKMKSLEDVDPDEYKKLKEQQRQIEEEKLQKDGEFEKLREKWSKEREQEKSKYESQIKTLNEQLDTLYLQDKIRQEMRRAGVRSEREDKALALVKDSIQRGDDGASILILDQDGDATDKTLSEYFSKDFKDEMPEFYKSDVLPGSGSQPGNGAPKNKNWRELSPSERMNYARAQQK